MKLCADLGVLGGAVIFGVKLELSSLREEQGVAEFNVEFDW